MGGAEIETKEGEKAQEHESGKKSEKKIDGKAGKSK
jgi:hypothetical protein